MISRDLFQTELFCDSVLITIMEYGLQVEIFRKHSTIFMLKDIKKMTKKNKS